MPNYRRYRVEGATYFFTLVTYDRSPFLCTNEARSLLREPIDKCRNIWPFVVDAIVLLPDHLHTMWTLPDGDTDYSRRWGWIKKEFTKAWIDGGHREGTVSLGASRKRQHGVFQPRFWEHLISNEEDFVNHADYLHYNPVKHGYVQRVADWPWSSFHQWVKEGIYPANWGVN